MSRLLFVFVIFALIPAAQAVSQQEVETVAMSAIEYSRKWEMFLGHLHGLPDDKNWKREHEVYESFHESNYVIITGHVVKVTLEKRFSDVFFISLEGTDSTNEYGFKCNVYLDIDGYDAKYNSLDGIPQEQIRSVQVGDIVSVSYRKHILEKFNGEAFCINHNDWEKQKYRIDASLHDAIRKHAKEVIRYKNRANSWWKENAPDAKPKIYRVSEYESIPYDMQTAKKIQHKLARKIRKQYEDWTVSQRELYSKEDFNLRFNIWSINSIRETLSTMRDESFRIKVCKRKFTDVVEFDGLFGFKIPIPPKIEVVGYVWHWNPDDKSKRLGFGWVSNDLNQEIIEFLDKYPLEDINASIERTAKKVLEKRN